MHILAVETSCDETAIALVDFSQKKEKRYIKILEEKIASQVKIHEKFGGVFPAVAAREHLNGIDKLFSLSKITSTTIKKVDLIAVTKGPGLIPCLIVGSSFSKALSYKYKRHVVGANHLEGHLFSGILRENSEHELENVEFPALGLVVSGGHTELVLVESYEKYKLLGETLDDAAGEAFDKVARLLGLGYPGGPLIEKLAAQGDPTAFSFPRPMVGSKDHNFSFSGLKTAVLYKTKTFDELNDKIRADIAASFQKAVIDTLLAKLNFAIKTFSPKTLLFGGGVLANRQLRNAIADLKKKLNIKTLMPPRKYCGDNAVIIALAAYLKEQKSSWKTLDADANLGLG